MSQRILVGFDPARNNMGVAVLREVDANTYTVLHTAVWDTTKNKRRATTCDIYATLFEDIEALPHIHAAATCGVERQMYAREARIEGAVMGSLRGSGLTVCLVEPARVKRAMRFALDDDGAQAGWARNKADVLRLVHKMGATDVTNHNVADAILIAIAGGTKGALSFTLAKIVA